ncbi:MAG: MDR/zinc-dependent alcohol dehydrogenase-like family protein [Nannocystaceae bacterium]|nr:alcohol dehydrogenase catalytic domain-containing protein [bacterium]
MLALVFEDALHLVDIDPPIPEPHEAVVRVHRAGICGTDLAISRGYADVRGVLGHEFVGEVVDAQMAPQWIGRRVVGEINVACGSCGRCRAGLGNHCSRREVVGVRGRDGAMAEEVVVPVSNLHEVPDVLDDDAAVFVEPLAAAFRIIEQLDIDASTRVGVWGDGRLGLLIAMAMATTGCGLTVVGRHSHKLDLVRHTGATLRRSDDVMRPDFDVAIDATGRSAGFADALRHVRPGGTVVVKSTLAEPLSLDATRLVVDEITVLGSRCGPFEPAIEALAAGTIDPRPLVEMVYPLRHGLEAFEHASRCGALKVLLDPRS